MLLALKLLGTLLPTMPELSSPNFVLFCSNYFADVTLAKNRKIYVLAIFDCFDTSVLGIAMSNNTHAKLCIQMVENVCKSYPNMRGAIPHSNRGSQYKSEKYRATTARFEVIQSMDSTLVDCHDYAR